MIQQYKEYSDRVIQSRGRKRYLLLSLMIVVVIALFSLTSTRPAYAATQITGFTITPSQTSGSTMFTGRVFTAVVSFQSSESTLSQTCRIFVNEPAYNGTMSAGTPVTGGEPGMMAYTCTVNVGSTAPQLTPSAPHQVRFWLYDVNSAPLINGESAGSVTVDGSAPNSTMTAQISNAGSTSNPDWKIQMNATLTENATLNYLQNRRCQFRYFAGNQWINAGMSDANSSGQCNYTLDVSEVGLTAGTYALMVVAEDAFGNSESKTTGDAAVTVTPEMLGQSSQPTPTPTPTPTPDPAPVEDTDQDPIDPNGLGVVITEDGDEVHDDDVDGSDLGAGAIDSILGDSVNVKLWTAVLILCAIGVIVSLVMMVKRGWFGFIGRWWRGLRGGRKRGS